MNLFSMSFFENLLSFLSTFLILEYPRWFTRLVGYVMFSLGLNKVMIDLIHVLFESRFETIHEDLV